MKRFIKNDPWRTTLSCHEMARTLNDILFRRTGVGTLGHPGESVLKEVALTAGKELHWSASRIKEEIVKARKAFTIPKPVNDEKPRAKKIQGRRTGRKTEEK